LKDQKGFVSERTLEIF